MTDPQTRLPTAAEDAQHSEPATVAAMTVAAFVSRLDAIDELLRMCRGEDLQQLAGVASEETTRLVQELRGNVIAQSLEELVQAATRAFRHADGAPEDIDAGATYLKHRHLHVAELTELLEVIVRASDCDLYVHLLAPDDLGF